jgi:hypothetical protein
MSCSREIGFDCAGNSGKLWSGLSESNRHLNLGKVPYYHYTKAAYLINLITLNRWPTSSASRRIKFPAPYITLNSGN